MNLTLAQPSSISPDISCVKLTPPSVSVILAGSFSLPLSLPPAIASRTAFSISRCEVMPTFFRNPRRLVLKTSSFMLVSSSLGAGWVVQHVFAEIALAAVGAGVGVDALDVAVLAAGDIFRRAGRDIVGAAERVVIAAGIDHGGLAALEAAGEQRREERQGDEASCRVMSH